MRTLFRFSLSSVLLLCIFISRLAAQNGFTTVSGAIVDPNGIPWSGGTISAQLITQGGTTPSLNGQTFTATTASGLLGPGGTFTMRLGDNGVIVPSTTTWQFTVSISPGVPSPLGKGPQSFTVTTAINCGTNTPATCTANTMTITAALAPVPALSNSTGITQVSALPLTCTPGTTAPVFLTVAGTTGLGYYYCSGTNTWTNAGLSGAATIRMTDFGVVADSKVYKTGTWSNAQNPVTVTIGSTINDAPFTSLDTGKSCIGPFTQPTVATFTFVSATSGSCNALSTNSAAGGGFLVIGTDNGTNALSSWNTLMAFPHCGTLLLPNGIWWNSQPLVNTTNNCANGPAPGESGGLTVRPANGSSYSSMMFQPYNFVFGNCAAGSGCMYTATLSNQINLEDFSITGFNLPNSGTCGSGSNTEFAGSTNIRIRNVALTYGFQTCSNFFGNLSLSGGAQGAVIYGFTQFDNFGTGSGNQLMSISAPNVLIQDFCCSNLSIQASGSVVGMNNFYGQSNATTASTVLLSSASNSLEDYNSLFQGGGTGQICIDNSGVLRLHGSTVTCNGGSTFGIYMRNASPVLDMTNVAIQNGTTASISGDAGVGIIWDRGNNTNATTTNPYTGSWRPVGIPSFMGVGTGVCTASSTLFLYPSGQVTARTCTVAAESLLVPTEIVNQAGTLHNLRCTATAGGVNASSGAVTVRQNGANSTITATFGTGTTAKDSTHNVTVAVGDVITYQITTQAAETLAGVACQVQVN